ncbi:MAG TPA: hypothetical protein VL359_13050 [bacterium]|nr:hypothetical protein [bacterium]
MSRMVTRCLAPLALGMRPLLAGWALLALIAASAAAQTAPAPPGQNIDARCTSPSDRACIDWERGVAIAVGTGVPASFAQTPGQKNVTAMRAARLDAARNLLELIKGVAITSDTTVQQAMVSNDQVTTSIQGQLQSIREVDRPHYFSDGSIQIKLEANLRQVVPQDLYLGAPQDLTQGGSAPAPGGGISTSTTYTGLIIDARGTGVTPALAPKVLDPEGKEVYGSAFVSRQFAITQGMAGYVKSIDAARNTDRVKGNPAVVKAVKALGPNRSDLEISKDDAERLRDLAKTETFLRESRVMIVLD